MDYLIFQIGERQYFAKPGVVLEVDKLKTDQKTLEVDKILLISEGSKAEIGKPYLKKKVSFEILGNFRGPKIRVATYKAKSNVRKVTGQRREITKIKLV